MTKLLYVGQQIADELKNRISGNLARYRDGDFLDLEASGDWRIPLSIDVDLAELSGLTAGGATRGRDPKLASSWSSAGETQSHSGQRKPDLGTAEPCRMPRVFARALAITSVW